MNPYTRPADAWRQRLQAALAEPLTRREAAPGETRGSGHHDHAARRAGVLIAIVGAPEPYIYFTQRSNALRHHPGQISFPGGSVETFDDSVQAAALREAHEEIGLDPAFVEVLGELPEYRTVTGFVISPFVGWVDPAATVAPDAVEVERLFGVPLAYALDHQHFRSEPMERGGRTYQVYSIDYDANHIWGATAGILYGLLQRLGHVEQRDIARPGCISR
ncbi:CoA pyrophosphatase [Salinisphaera aquimarina]|uniref:CoA pyrophosphatase n=1 Tax=Salinisphaera aquimarina TaxID=2094031 RepID=A0ABV7ES50_9GAMM